MTWDACGTLDGQLLLFVGGLRQAPHSVWRVLMAGAAGTGAGEGPVACLCCGKGFLAVATAASPWEEPLGASPSFGCSGCQEDGDEGQHLWLKGIASSPVRFKGRKTTKVRH